LAAPSGANGLSGWLSAIVIAVLEMTVLFKASGHVLDTLEGVFVVDTFVWKRDNST
jgi:drug/metabolite transporter superfamily protein YnfA